MTVNSAVNKTIVLGDGVKTVFDFDFIGVASAYIAVILTDAAGNETILAEGSGTTQYQIALNPAVTGAIWGLGGSVTYDPLGTPVPAGSTLTIFRTLPLTQAISLQRMNSLSTLGNGAETGLDLLTMELQQVSEGLARAIVAPIVDATAPAPLPPIAQRANQGAVFDGDGNLVAGSLPASGVISTAMQPVVDAATLALGRTAFGLGNIAVENIGAGLQDDGAGNVRSNWALTSDSTNKVVTALYHQNRRIATGPIAYTLPRANTLWNGFGFWIEVPAGGVVTLAIDSNDKIENQATGVSGTIGLGMAAFVTTDAANAGTWRVETSFLDVSGFISLVTNSAGTPTLKAGTNPGTGDDTAFLAARAVAPLSGLLNTHAFRDESAAVSNASASAFSGYSSFDAAPVITGANITAMNHIHGFQARPVYAGLGTLTEMVGFTAQATATHAGGIIGASYGFFVASPILSGGAAITNQYAFYSNPLSGATNSYFLFGSGVNGSTANPSVLNGNLYVGGRIASISAEIMNIQFNGSTQFALTFIDTYGVAGSTSAAIFNRNTTNVGSITTTLAATAYNTSSDERLKDFIGDYDPAEAVRIIRADPVRAFTWKRDGTAAIGWGAQHSYAISPDLAAPGDGDPRLKEGDEGFHPWGIDQGKRTPYLWAALSQALDRIDALEARLAAAGIGVTP